MDFTFRIYLLDIVCHAQSVNPFEYYQGNESLRGVGRPYQQVFILDVRTLSPSTFNIQGS